MSERKKITTLFVITDSENSYDNIGDIDGGGFDEEWLKAHVKSHGIEGLTITLSWMNFQVFSAMRDVNRENEKATSASVSKS